jgi:hypothetical protein
MTAEPFETCVCRLVEPIDGGAETTLARWVPDRRVGVTHERAGRPSTTGASVAASSGLPPNSGHHCWYEQ